MLFLSKKNAKIKDFQFFAQIHFERILFLILNKNPLKMNQSKKLKILKLCIFLTQKEHPSPQKAEVYTQKTENRPTYGYFEMYTPRLPNSPNF